MSESLDDTIRTEQWHRHLEYLATLGESRQPIVSCYVNLDMPDDETRSYLLGRAESIVRTWQDGVTSGFIRDALASALRQTSRNHDPDTRGLAVFARGGDRSFCLPMRFECPVPTSLTVDLVPHLYNLFALKDSSNCHVILMSTSEFAAIFEVFLGPVSTEFAEQRPFESTHFGRQWTCLHYLDYRREYSGKLIGEKLRILDRLMSDDGHGHLMLVGEAPHLQNVRRALPKHHARRLRDIHELPIVAEESVVLAESLRTFAREEKCESVLPPDWLFSSYYRDELAVLGPADSLSAMFHGLAHTLVISADRDLGSTNFCERCGWSSSIEPPSRACGDCGAHSLGRCDVRQELVKMANRSNCTVETVDQSGELQRAGGVGCILRYLSRDTIGAGHLKDRTQHGPTHL